MKKMRRIILFLSLLLVYPEFFTEEPDELKIKGLDFSFDANYLSLPNTFEFALDVIHNDSKISPFIDMGTDYYQMILFGTGLSYAFRSFSSKLFYEIRIPFNLNSKSIEHMGNLSLGYNFDYLKLDNNLRIGWINHLLKVKSGLKHKYLNTLTLENKVDFLAPIYYSESQRAETKVSFIYKYLLENQNQIYQVHWNFKYLLAIPFGEIGLKSDFLQSDSLTKTELNTRINYNSLNFYPVALPSPNDTKSSFNTIFNFGFEYRIFFLEHLRNVVSDLFLVLSFDTGYGLSDSFLDNGRFLYISSLGVGYKFFKEVPFVFKVGINQEKRLLFGFIVSSIIFDI
ncbi:MULTISPECIES: hypothetical protein [unclassified Borrelia]|uniref:hypothetical protein n=1 Tax=unclassified Borrelia TaxID=2649934 RepID=UPI001E642E54|nr:MULTISPECIES: hypothetical protein [unclassified Borrelia]UGQ16586.1 hypothetical protein LSO06_04535 [Borrelia sp. RT5S]UGQ17744.1 hypothetical protein LSO05_04770 [Borrelia sp. RT1S]